MSRTCRDLAGEDTAIINALTKFIPGHIARYGDEYTSNAFGDNFTAWGTPTILIETGGHYGHDEMFVVKVNFVAFLTALQSLATGSEVKESMLPYQSLIENSSGSLVNFIFRKGNLVNFSSVPGATPDIGIADLGCVTQRRRASFLAPTNIRAVGDLTSLRGLEEYDASNFYVVQRFGRTRVGELAELVFYKRDRVIDWSSTELEKQFPPDAVFSMGKWVKGAGVVPKK